MNSLSVLHRSACVCLREKKNDRERGRELLPQCFCKLLITCFCHLTSLLKPDHFSSLNRVVGRPLTLCSLSRFVVAMCRFSTWWLIVLIREVAHTVLRQTRHPCFKPLFSISKLTSWHKEKISDFQMVTVN